MLFLLLLFVTDVVINVVGHVILTAYFWLAEYLAWNNRSVLIIRNNLATIDLKTKDSKKEKKTKIRKVVYDWNILYCNRLTAPSIRMLRLDSKQYKNGGHASALVALVRSPIPCPHKENNNT